VFGIYLEMYKRRPCELELKHIIMANNITFLSIYVSESNWEYVISDILIFIRKFINKAKKEVKNI